MEDTDWAYVAGLVDGEGCIRATHNKRGTNYRIMITNSDWLIMEWLCEFTGLGKYYARHDKFRTKPIYNWVLQNLSDVRYFLTMIEPYAKIKADQIGLMLELVNHRLSIQALRYNGSVDEIDHNLMAQITKLNHRGGD